MIYTVTLNPALDYFMTFDDEWDTYSTNRADSVKMLPGGKGLIESRMMKLLDIPNVAWGFIGGFPGKFVRDYLAKNGVKTNFTQIYGKTRMNVTIKSIKGETSFNAAGPELTEADVAEFLSKFDILKTGDIVAMAGQSPKCLGADFYEHLIREVKERGADFTIDSEGKGLLDALDDGPLVVKPNKEELAAAFNTLFTSKEDIIPYGKRMLEMGAQNAMVSMAGEGALLFSEDKVYFAPPIPGKIANSVGAGDSMVAGFIGEYSQTHSALAAFRQGVACGTAKAFSEDMPSQEFLMEMFEKVEIVEL